MVLPSQGVALTDRSAAKAGALDIVAIDGPAGTGKSTTARGAACALGWRYVDSGAFYRVAALLALRHDRDLSTEEGRTALRALLADAEVEQEVVAGALRVRVDGEDVTSAIRSPSVTRIVSRVADDPALRGIVNEDLRARVGDEPAVVDGRDIGTVVFPNAILKIFLEASLEIRARRRARELEPPERAEDPAVLASYEQSLAERDRADRARSTGRLAAAEDAIHIDTTGLDIETQIAKVVKLVTSEVGNSLTDNG